MSDDQFPLGKPLGKAPAPEPEWVRKLKARNTDTGLPPGITRQADGKWQTENKIPASGYCPHLNTIMGVCATCGTVVVP